MGDADLDPGGLTFRNFGISDNGSSFSRFDSTFGNNAANPTPSRVLEIDSANGLARVRFDTIRAEVSLPLGWQATEDWERGVAYSGDGALLAAKEFAGSLKIFDANEYSAKPLRSAAVGQPFQ